MKREEGEPPPTLDLDGEVEMQGRDSGEAEAQHNNGSEGIEEPPWPTPAREHVIETQENEIDMREEGVTGGGNRSAWKGLVTANCGEEKG